MAVMALFLAASGCAGHKAATSTTTARPARRATGPAAPASGTAHTTTPSTTTPSTTAPRARRVSVSIADQRLPQPISRAVAVADGDHVRLLGGRTTAHTSTDQIVDWSPDTPAAVTGHLARRVHDAAGVTVDGNTLLFGGGDGGSVANVQEVGPTGSGKIVGTLGTPRSDVSAVAIGGTGFVIGGFDDKGGVPDVLTTSDGRSFATIGRLPSQIRYGAAAASQGRVLVFGGEDEHGSTDAVLSIDPATGTTSRVATIPVRLSHAVAFVLRDEVYVAGGQTDGARVSTIWHYDQGTQTLAEVGRLPDARSDAAAAVVGDTAYLVGGEAPDAVDSVVAVSVS